MFILINQQPDTDQIYLYTRDPYAEIYQSFSSKQEIAGLKHFIDSKAFIEYSNDMDGIYKDIEEHSPNKGRTILIVFDDMVAGMLSNKKRASIVTELFIRGKKFNITCPFNSMHYFFIKTSNKRELQQIGFNHSSDIEFKDSMKLYIKCTAKADPFLITDATLLLDNHSRCRYNVLERIRSWQTMIILEMKNCNMILALIHLSIYYKKSYKNNNLNEEIELHDGSYIVYQIFKIILNISSENMKQLLIIL